MAANGDRIEPARCDKGALLVRLRAVGEPLRLTAFIGEFLRRVDHLLSFPFVSVSRPAQRYFGVFTLSIYTFLQPE